MMDEHGIVRKAWVKPELIVLARSRPEEAVLRLCKGYLSDGPKDFQSRCYTKISEMTCEMCAIVAFS